MLKRAFSTTKIWALIGLAVMLLAPKPGPAQPPAFDAAAAFQELERQCSFGPRNPGSEGHAAYLSWVTDYLRTLCDELYLQSFQATEGLTGTTQSLTNIIASFESGSGPPLMLCAHWDTRAWADQDPNPENRQQPIPGANDGASGVAVLLEIARLAALEPPPRPLLIVLFDGEDMGVSSHSEQFALGSLYWAEHIIPEKPTEAILLDMIGDADLEIQIEWFSERKAPGLRSYLWELAHQLDLDAFVEIPGPAVFDDHVPLQNVGIRAVDLIDFEYPYWHTLSDTPEHCAQESLEQIGKLLRAFIYGIE